MKQSPDIAVPCHLKFRSPHLKAGPDESPAPAFSQRCRRMALPLTVLFLILFFGYVFTVQPFPKSGIFIYLYQFHDHVLLPLKGALFTGFLPFSMIAWGTGVTLLGLWIVSAVTGMRIIPRIQMVILEKMIRVPSLQPVLEKTGRFLHRLGFPQELMREIAFREWRKRRRRALQDPGDEFSVHRLLRTARMLLTLQAPSKASIDESLNIADQWLQILMISRISGVHINEKDADVLTDEAGKFIAKLPAGGGEKPGFGLSSIVSDLSLIVHGCHAPSSVSLAPLAESVRYRLTLLNTLRAYLEACVLRNKAGSQESDAVLHKILRDLPRSDECGKKQREMIGRLALTTGIYLAVETKTPETALNWIDALEGLSLAMDCADLSRDDRLQELKTVVSDMTDSLPAPEDYKICAEMVRSALRGEREGSVRSMLLDDGVIRPEDVERVEGMIEGLELAAGSLKPF